jgi:hypothetical protein
MMKLTRLRQRANQLPNIEVEEEFLLASTVLVHLERLRQVRVLTKKSWILSDSFEAHFDYRGQRFVMEMPFGCITITALDATTSLERIQELAAHIDNYRIVWPTHLVWAIVRYFFLPLEATDLVRPGSTAPQRESKRVSAAP